MERHQWMTFYVLLPQPDRTPQTWHEERCRRCAMLGHYQDVSV